MIIFVYSNLFLEKKNAEACNKVVMCITYAMNRSTDGPISASHIELDVWSLLALIHERQACRITKEGFRSNIQYAVVMIALCLSGHIDLYKCILRLNIAFSEA